MRVSSRESDAGFRVDAADFTVMLNGEPVRCPWIIADEAAGEVHCGSGYYCHEIKRGTVNVYKLPK